MFYTFFFKTPKKIHTSKSHFARLDMKLLDKLVTILFFAIELIKES